jgi:hypothetical protein
MEDAVYLNSLFEYKEGKLFWKVSRSSRIKVGQEAGNLGKRGYRAVRIDGKLYLTHRLIFLMIHNYVPQYLDHIDGDRLNNRIENLRPATKLENSRNVKLSKKNTTGFKGVVFDKDYNKWRAQIYHNGKCHYLGGFDSLDEAVHKVKTVRESLHGEFCKHE